jgi:hypothetical protein
MGKIDLQHIKAAMVLALDSTKANTTAIWWSGVAYDMEKEQVVVLQVPKDYTDKAIKVLKGYKVYENNMIEGSSYDLLPIRVEYLENCLTQRVTRKWLTDVNVDEGGPHIPFKKEVIDRMDDLGIDYLKMSYSGSGDSSNPDEWNCSRVSVGEWYPNDWHSDEGKHWREQSCHEVPEDLATTISEYVWETLVQYDCVNNDGGGGDLTIIATEDEPEFLFSCYTNEMVSTNHHSEDPI